MIKILEKYRYKIYSLIYNKLKLKNNKNLLTNQYWDFRFNKFRYHHSRQNEYIAQDFLKNISNNEHFLSILSNSKTMLEVGCGTGEFSQIIYNKFKNFEKIIATDISEEGIMFAQKKNKNKKIIDYKVYNSLENNQGFESLGKFDVVLCSNVLEHFKNPFILFNQMKMVAKYIIILVPYNHLSKEESIGDGGEGHVFCFNENTFKNYSVISQIKFKSKGWQNIKDHPNPLQFAVLIKA